MRPRSTSVARLSRTAEPTTTTLLSTAGGEVMVYSPRSRMRMPCVRSMAPPLRSRARLARHRVERDEARVQRAGEDATKARALLAGRRVFPHRDTARGGLAIVPRAIDVRIVRQRSFPVSGSSAMTMLVAVSRYSWPNASTGVDSKVSLSALAKPSPKLACVVLPRDLQLGHVVAVDLVEAREAAAVDVPAVVAPVARVRRLSVGCVRAGQCEQQRASAKLRDRAKAGRAMGGVGSGHSSIIRYHARPHPEQVRHAVFLPP